MTVIANPPQPPFNILRAGHAELLVSDLGRARAFYCDLLGFVETERDDERLYLRCLEDREHHALVLRRAPSGGAGHLAFRVATPDDLDKLATLAAVQGLPWRWAEGQERGQGRALRLQDPCGLPLEFYHDMAPAERLLQRYDRQHPVQIMRIDHFNCQVPDAAFATAWYQRELGFFCTEYTAKAEAEGDLLWAAWLRRKQTVHDLALMNGVGPRLHHVAFWLPDALTVLRVCDVLAAAGHHAAIERGPGRHGLSNALFLYLRDPDGNRIELYANDYLAADPDAAPLRWTLDDPRRATFWGHAAPPCWFEEAMAVESVLDGSLVPQQQPLLQDRPSHVT